MKATLLALLTLGSLAMAEDAITLSSPTGTLDQTGYTSFDFRLDSSWLTKAPQDVDLAEYVNLTSVTVTPAATWFNQYESHRTGGAGMAIYQKSTGQGVWNFVGSSDWESNYTANGSTKLTFDFSRALTLSSDTVYTAVFYGNQNVFNALTPASTLASLAGVQTPSSDNPVVAFGMKSLKNTTTPNFAIYSSTGAALNQSPYVTFTVQNQNVPEPMTGTLSLLALAGLCIRRRK